MYYIMFEHLYRHMSICSGRSFLQKGMKKTWETYGVGFMFCLKITLLGGTSLEGICPFCLEASTAKGWGRNRHLTSIPGVIVYHLAVAWREESMLDNFWTCKLQTHLYMYISIYIMYIHQMYVYIYIYIHFMYIHQMYIYIYIYLCSIYMSIICHSYMPYIIPNK